MFSSYLKLERRQSTKKDGTESRTPRYAVTAQAGYFKPLNSLKNRKGEIVMYRPGNDNGNPNSTAEMRLQCQCQGSVNFSSIYFLDLKLGETLIGYGEPPRNEMLKPVRKKKKDGSITLVEHPNPFYENRMDGYLFIVAPVPDMETIEILVVPNGQSLIRGHAAKLADGQLDDALEQMRNEAKPV
jgi:hypothetical protein